MARQFKNFSTIGFNPMVESVNRKFARRIDKCNNRTITRGASGNSGIKLQGITYMGASSRIVNLACIGPTQKNVMFFRRPINLKVSQSSKALNARAFFLECLQWVREGKTDLQTFSQNQIKWNTAKKDRTKRINGVSAEGYATPDGWMFAVVHAGIYNGGAWDGHLPSTHALPDFDA